MKKSSKVKFKPYYSCFNKIRRIFFYLILLIITLSFLFTKYYRKNWGSWKKINKINIRHRVLAEESIEKIRWRKNKVISGKWLSVYTGNVLTNSRKLDIDHLVPLFEAWQSGGCKWTKELKRTYYNDMNNSNHLVAVEATINRKKSAKDLAEWLPGVNQLWYIESWVEIKRHWGLTVDNKEAAIISNYGVKLIGLKIEPEETRCW